MNEKDKKAFVARMKKGRAAAKRKSPLHIGIKSKRGGKSATKPNRKITLSEMLTAQKKLGRNAGRFKSLTKSEKKAVAAMVGKSVSYIEKYLGIKK